MLEDFVSSRLLFLCQHKGISRYELCKRSGVSQTVLTDVINKKHLPSLVTLEKLCKGLEISLSYFFLTTDDIPGLSEEQEEILDLWENLRLDEQRTIKLTMKNLKNRE